MSRSTRRSSNSNREADVGGRLEITLTLYLSHAHTGKMFTKLRALATPTTALRRLSYKRVNPTAPEYNETIQRGHE